MERPLAPSEGVIPSLPTGDQVSTSKNGAFIYVLVALSVMIIIGMVIGIIFIAHYYFHIWGGQGLMKARRLVQI